MVAPKPGKDAAAAVSPLQAHAGNRATAILLGGLAGRRSVQRDALAGTVDESRPGVDPQAGDIDPATLSGDGESGPKPSDWAQPGAGGDGPAPALPATTGDATTGGATTGESGGGSSAGGGQAVVDQATNLIGDAIGGSADPARGRRQPGGGQGAGGGGGQTTGGTGAGTAQPAQASGGAAAPGAQDWTQRPEGAAIIKVLSGSTVGQEALAAATKFAVIVVFQAKGRPAAYDAGDNHCYLDPATATNELATYFVHEMYHARQSQLGLSPLPDKAPDREAWVDSMVKEEVTATYRSFEARVEAGISTPLGAGPARRRVEPVHARPPVLARGALEEQPERRRRRRGALDRQGPGTRPVPDRRSCANGGTLPALGPDRISSYADFYRRQWNIAHRARP